MQIRQKEYQECENKNCPLLFSRPEQIESRRSYICYDDYESNNDQEENDTFYYCFLCVLWGGEYCYYVAKV